MTKLSMYTVCRYKTVRYYSYGGCESSVHDYDQANVQDLIRVHVGFEEINKLLSTQNWIDSKEQSDTEQIVVDSHSSSDSDSSISRQSTIDDLDYVPPENIYMDPSISGQSHLGYKMTSIELDREWISVVQEHTQSCVGSNLQLVDALKNGFELIDTYKCDKCHIELSK